jgi:hypothetical protein
MRVPSRVPLAVIERGPWAEPPLVTFCENGTAEVQAATCDLDAAARWVLECGTEAEALTPSPSAGEPAGKGTTNLVRLNR